MDRPLVYYWKEAISETSLHSSSIHSSKISTLLPTPLTDARQPTIILQWSTYTPWLILPYCLHSLSNCEWFWWPNNQNFTKKLPSCKTPYISGTPTPCFSIYQDHQWQWPKFATNQQHSWTSTSSWYAPQLPLICLPNGYTTNNWATQQRFPTNEFCDHLSSELCDLSRLIYKSPWTDWHPWWKHPIFFHQIPLHSDSKELLQLLNQFPTQSWVPTLPCYQDYWCYWPPNVCYCRLQNHPKF